MIIVNREGLKRIDKLVNMKNDSTKYYASPEGIEKDFKALPTRPQQQKRLKQNYQLVEKNNDQSQDFKEI